MRSPPEGRAPKAADLRAAAGRRIPDLVVPDLTVLFCGINPGLYSAATKHHFARPGNRFWPALHLAGFTDRLLAPHETDALLESGYGITSLVRRATATAREVAPSELIAGRRRLNRLVRANRPQWIAVLGVGAYRTAFRDPRAEVGPQPNSPLGTRIWVLPSPSGANGSYPLVDLVRELRAFRAAIGSCPPRSRS
ncbi:MAG: G/U mismatch-specific DNA glycosylase [Gemmatimonadaceae bacterium]|nr:G/U mismatch-specific DNA glycosylase [Gemmatimonadaceae bacterium]